MEFFAFSPEPIILVMLPVSPEICESLTKLESNPDIVLFFPNIVPGKKCKIDCSVIDHLTMK